MRDDKRSYVVLLFYLPHHCRNICASLRGTKLSLSCLPLSLNFAEHYARVLRTMVNGTTTLGTWYFPGTWYLFQELGTGKIIGTGVMRDDLYYLDDKRSHVAAAVLSMSPLNYFFIIAG